MMYPALIKQFLSIRSFLIVLLSIILLILRPHISSPQSSGTFDPGPYAENKLTPPPFFRAAIHTTPGSDIQSYREKQCLKAGKWIGMAAGSFMGTAQIIWSLTGESGVHGSFGQNLATGVPSALIGGYVGSKTTPWMTKRIIRGNPTPARTILRGALYGAANGAMILTASFLPLFLIGHALDTIEFNTSQELIELKLIRISIVGGTLYGGTFGAMLGTAYGTGISLYMRF